MANIRLTSEAGIVVCSRSVCSFDTWRMADGGDKIVCRSSREVNDIYHGRVVNLIGTKL